MTRIILVRHCEAEGNFKRVFQGHTDSDISENGKKQLALLSLRCRNMKIDAIYSSPLKRAYHTAQAVNQYHNLPIHLREGLIEINGGHFEGQLWEKLPELFPEEATAWNMTPYDFNPEGGESMRSVYDRIWNTILDIVKENEGKTVCVASHGCAIRNFLCRASGRPIEELNEVDWCDNTALSVIDFDEQLHPIIVVQNDASHLTQETSTLAKQSWWKRENREKNLFV